MRLEDMVTEADPSLGPLASAPPDQTQTFPAWMAGLRKAGTWPHVPGWCPHSALVGHRHLRPGGGAVSLSTWSGRGAGPRGDPGLHAQCDSGVHPLAE